jgi:hypothetical protein
LSRVPLELSEQEDIAPSQQQSMEVPLEVSEEEALAPTPPVAKPAKQPARPTIPTKPQVAVKPTTPPAPAIQERIPNV